MELHLGGRDNEYIFKYDRSRFRSGIIGTLFTSLLTAVLGSIVWPILRDMRSNWVETLHTVALMLAGVMIIMALIWLYFIIRMIVFFVIHVRGSGASHHSIIPACIALLVAIIVVAIVPLIIFGLNLI